MKMRMLRWSRLFRSKKKEYALFPGCVISLRFPQFESSTINVLSRLGIELNQLEDVTCCPEPTSMRMLNSLAWYTIAARNICLAEEKGLDILTICNGCNATLFRVNEDLKMNSKLRMTVNEKLKEIGKEFTGKIDVKSLLRVLYKDIGPAKIKENVKKTFHNIKVAVHYGCHIFDEIRMYDDAKNPKSLKDLVQALGANVTPYSSEMLCCGGHMARYIDEGLSLNCIEEKLADLTNVNADCLVVICPYCFLNYDLGQMILAKNFKKKIQTPILYYPQLLGLAMGFGARDMGLELHKVKAHELIEKIESTL